jgi:hypothetical protein
MTEKPDPLSVFGKPADEDRRIEAYQDTQIVGRIEKPPIATRLREIAETGLMEPGARCDIRALASEIEAKAEEMRAEAFQGYVNNGDAHEWADTLAARKEPVETEKETG